jgi:hypothetical protein
MGASSISGRQPTPPVATAQCAFRQTVDGCIPSDLATGTMQEIEEERSARPEGRVWVRNLPIPPISEACGNHLSGEFPARWARSGGSDGGGGHFLVAERAPLMAQRGNRQRLDNVGLPWLRKAQRFPLAAWTINRTTVAIC